MRNLALALTLTFVTIVFSGCGYNSEEKREITNLNVSKEENVSNDRGEKEVKVRSKENVRNILEETKQIVVREVTESLEEVKQVTVRNNAESQQKNQKRFMKKLKTFQKR